MEGAHVWPGPIPIQGGVTSSRGGGAAQEITRPHSCPQGQERLLNLCKTLTTIFDVGYRCFHHHSPPSSQDGYHLPFPKEVRFGSYQRCSATLGKRTGQAGRPELRRNPATKYCQMLQRWQHGALCNGLPGTKEASRRSVGKYQPDPVKQFQGHPPRRSCSTIPEDSQGCPNQPEATGQVCRRTL
jgi:hypothetical protein